MSDVKADDESSTRHLDEIEDGAGCTEIREHLSDRREAEAEAADDEDD